LNLGLLKDVDATIAEFHVLVFLGAKQKTISADFAQSLQSMGASAKYIQCSVTQKNAADFLLSYHLGRLVEADPGAYFHIISKDTGFDSLVTHLRDAKHKVYRHVDICEIAVVAKQTNALQKQTNVQQKPTNVLEKQTNVLQKNTWVSHSENVVENLKGRGTSKPRKVKTLKSTIQNLIKSDPDANADKVFNALVRRQVVIVDGEKVSYKL
jgi:hypothetical protein